MRAIVEGKTVTLVISNSLGWGVERIVSIRSPIGIFSANFWNLTVEY